jgi:uncharacterized damage-inducible protein DinB/predicted Zn-ribbon and HTH transcriptional regulator
MSSESDLIDLYRLARACTDAGYYQAAKLFTVAATSLLNRQLANDTLPKTDAALSLAIDEIEPRLSQLEINGDLLEAIQHANDEISAGRMNFIPPVFACRACGQVAMSSMPSFCPHCGAGQLTFQYFPAAYYLEPEAIDRVLMHLAATPDWLDYILADLSAEQAAQKVGGVEGEWSLREAASHMLDAQQLIDGRVELFLTQAAPNLSGKSPSEMVDQSGLSAAEIARAFRSSRQHMIDRLKAAPKDYWYRVGQHSEFGPVTLQQQATYFAKHEHWHMAQMTRIRKAVS